MQMIQTWKFLSLWIVGVDGMWVRSCLIQGVSLHFLINSSLVASRFAGTKSLTKGSVDIKHENNYMCQGLLAYENLE